MTSQGSAHARFQRALHRKHPSQPRLPHGNSEASTSLKHAARFPDEGRAGARHDRRGSLADLAILQGAVRPREGAPDDKHFRASTGRRHASRSAEAYDRRAQLAARRHYPTRGRTLRVVEVNEGNVEHPMVLVVEDTSG
jgi:hypothetical protein